MTRLWMRPVDEDRLLEEVAYRQRALRIRRRGVTPQMAAMAETYADAYPWMDPTATQSFLQAGVPADDPRIQQAATLAAEDIQPEGTDEVADTWYESLLDMIGKPVKAVVRGGLTALAAPFEEIQALVSSAGEVVHTDPKHEGGWTVAELIQDLGELPEDVSRFWDNYTNKAARSAGSMAVANLIRGEEVDLGEGFLPGSYSADTQSVEGFTGGLYGARERQKHRLQLDGTFVTPGRLIARDIVEPGTTAYNFVSGAADFAMNIWGDPAFWASAGLSKAAKANRAFQTVGLIPGTRKTVSAERAVEHYLTNPVGQRFKQWLTETTDARQIWEATGKADLRLARALAQAGDETTVHGLLSDALGTVIREKPTAGFVSRQVGRAGGDYGRLFGGGAVVKKSMNAHNVRAFRDMPGTKLNPANVNQAAVDLEAWMRTAKMSDEAISRHLDDVARVADGDANSLLAVAENVMADAEGLLVKEWGVRPSEARNMTRMWGDLVRDHRAYYLDELGREVDVLAPLRVNIDGKTLDASPTAGIVAELINGTVPLPDPREIRRHTTRLAPLWNSGLVKGTRVAAEAAMSVWKPMQLLRGAYTVRVIGEEQVRMAGAGMDSLFRHPGSAIAWAVSVDPKSKLGQRIAKLAKEAVDPKGTTTVTGEAFEEVAEHAAALSRGSAGHRGMPGELLTGRWGKVRPDEPGFYRGWATELAHYTNDPVMRRVAGGLNEADIASVRRGLGTAGKVIDDAVDWTPSGSNFEDVSQWFWSGTGQRWRKQLAVAHGDLGNQLLHNRQAADDYLRHNYFDRLAARTGGNSELVELVAKGQIDDVSLRNFGHERKLAQILEERFASARPNYAKVEDSVRLAQPGHEAVQRLNALVEHGFDTLMSKPTNWLSRSPTFRRTYWERAAELVGFADRPTQEAVLRAARSANVGDDALKRMAKSVVQGEGSRLTSLDAVDALAKSHALDETKKLLYDLNKRSQIFDMMRVVFPFGEAWKEIITSWGRIIYQNPQVARRAQQAIHAGRGGDQDPSTGFFHTDPQTGDEVFTYAAPWLSKAVLGTDKARFELTGRVAGLNIVAATVLPGFGPAVQIPASYLIPRKPKFDQLREIVLPFGDSKNLPQAFAPAWVEKVWKGIFSEPESDRLFANTVADVMRALHRSGDYPIDTPQGINTLVDDASDKARALYLIRGFAQSVLPTGPSFTWETADAEGNLVPVKLLSDELRRMTDEEYGGDRNAAFVEWVRRFGVENVLAIQAKSQEVLERPVTTQGDEWLRANPELERTYPLTIGYFAPEPAVGQFDYSAYLRAFDTGARAGLKPDEMVALANNFLGRVEYEQVKRVAETRPGTQTSMWLAQVRREIAQRRPGFDSWIADKVRSQRPAVDTQIAELRNAVTDPTIATTDAGRGTIKYLSAIDVAEKMVPALPGSARKYQQAKSAAPVRHWLRSVAEEIIAEHPDFARVFYGIFERELADDEPVALPAA